MTEQQEQWMWVAIFASCLLGLVILGIAISVLCRLALWLA